MKLNLKFGPNTQLLRKSWSQNVGFEEGSFVRFVRLGNSPFWLRLNFTDYIRRFFARSSLVMFFRNISYINNFRILPVLIVPILENESDARHSDSHEDDNKHTTNVLNRNTVRLIFGLLTLPLKFFVFPPVLFKLFQLTLVEQCENSTKCKITKCP